MAGGAGPFFFIIRHGCSNAMKERQRHSCAASFSM